VCVCVCVCVSVCAPPCLSSIDVRFGDLRLRPRHRPSPIAARTGSRLRACGRWAEVGEADGMVRWRTALARALLPREVTVTATVEGVAELRARSSLPVRDANARTREHVYASLAHTAMCTVQANFGTAWPRGRPPPLCLSATSVRARSTLSHAYHTLSRLPVQHAP
jgi:hypothetical protein